MIKSAPGRLRKRYGATPKALLIAAFKGAGMGALLAFVVVKLWSAI